MTEQYVAPTSESSRASVADDGAFQAVVPAVSSETPVPNATDIAVSSPVTATFNEAVQASTIVFTLKNSSGVSVGATVAYNSTSLYRDLDPECGSGLFNDLHGRRSAGSWIPRVIPCPCQSPGRSPPPPLHPRHPRHPR